MLLLTAHASWWNQHTGIVTLVGVIIAVVGILVALVIYLLQRDRKTFDWQILTDEPIGQGAAPGAIKVISNSAELRNPRLITIRLLNSGKKEIRPDEFYAPAIVHTDPALTIMMANNIAQHEGMVTPPDLFFSDNTCMTRPVLYNRGDWIDIQLVVDSDIPRMSYETPIRVESVIAGQTRQGKLVVPRLSGPHSRVPWLIGIVGVVIVVSAVVALNLQPRH